MALAAIAVLLAGGFLCAQSQQQATSTRRPAFEVVSIKPSRPDEWQGMLIKPGGRYESDNNTVRAVIGDAYAYGQPAPFLRDNQILGGPKWIDSKRYTIEAKVDPALVQSEEKKLPVIQWRAQIQLMIQSMLADRFKLKIKEE